LICIAILIDFALEETIATTLQEKFNLLTGYWFFWRLMPITFYKKAGLVTTKTHHSQMF
jgi:hypothetical protein